MNKYTLYYNIVLEYKQNIPVTSGRGQWLKVLFKAYTTLKRKYFS